MAGTAHSLRIVVDAEDRASQVLGVLRGTLEGLGEHFRTLGTVALSGLGALASAATGAGAAIAKLAVDAAPLEDIRKAFAGFAESAGVNADEMIAALERGSSGMVSQRDLMLSFNKAAQLVGRDFAVKLPEAMQYLSKVSASTGTSMNFLLESLVVGVGRLSPLILDNLGIQVSLEQATERSAKMFGVKAEQLSKAQLQAGMMAVILDRLRENTDAIPISSGTAAEGIAQLSAAFQNAKDTIGLLFVPSLATVLNAVKPLVHGAITLLVGILRDHVVPVVTAAATAFATFIGAVQEGQPLLDALRGALAMVMPPTLLAQIDRLRAGVESVITAARPYVEHVATWIRNHVTLHDVLITVGSAIASIVVPALWSIVSAVAPVLGVFMLAVSVAALLRHAWESNFFGIRTITANVMKSVHTLITNATAFLRNLWGQHGGEVLAMVQGMWKRMQATISSAVTFVHTLITSATASISDLWEQHGDEVLAIVQRLWDGMLALISTAVASVRTLITSATESIRTAVAFMRDVWAQHGDEVLALVQELWNRMLATISTAIAFARTLWQQHGDEVLALVQGLWSGIQATIDSSVSSVRTFIISAITSIRDLWQQHGDEMLAMAQGLWDGMLATISSAIAFMLTFWQQHGNEVLAIVQGLWNGIQATISSAGALVWTLVTMITAFIRDLWAQHGSDMLALVQGIWNGILATISSAIAFMRTFWQQHGDEVLAIVQELWNGIQATIITAVAFVCNLIMITIAFIRDLWQQHGDEVVAIVQGIWDVMLATITGAVAFASELWQKHGDEVLAIVQLLWNGIQVTISSTVALVCTLITSATAFISDLWQQHGDKVLAILQLIWDRILATISIAMDIIRSLFAAFEAAFYEDWYAFGANLRVAWDRLWSGIVEELRGWGVVLIETIRLMITGIIQSFREVDWGRVGRDIVSGIANGIRTSATWLAEEARYAASAALEAAKGFLGIRSPSAVFEQIGQQMMAGWARGIEMNARLPALRTRDAADQTVGVATAGSGVTIQTLVVYADEPETFLRRLQAYA